MWISRELGWVFLNCTEIIDCISIILIMGGEGGGGWGVGGGFGTLKVIRKFETDKISPSTFQLLKHSLLVEKSYGWAE